MDASQVFGQGIGFPPRVGADGRMVWSAGAPNVRESITIILLTQRHERLYQPDFGGNLNTYLLEPNTVTTHHLIETEIERALRRWEPRIAVESVNVAPDAQDPLAAVATITYQLVATQTREQISFNVPLAS